MRTCLKEWRAINGHPVKQPFYEHSVCKWGGTTLPLNPRSVFNFRPCEPASNTARSIYTPSSCGLCWPGNMFFPLQWRDSGSKRRASPPPGTHVILPPFPPFLSYEIGIVFLIPEIVSSHLLISVPPLYFAYKLRYILSIFLIF